MRRSAAVLACVTIAVAALGFFSVPAHGGPTFVASYTLGPAPSWQTSDQKAQLGSWVKHSSPVVANLGDGPAILVGSSDGKLYALRYSGGKLTKLWDTGNAITTFINSSPAVADLNGDGCPEVIVGAGDEFHPQGAGVHVFDCHGQHHQFWPAPVNPSHSNQVGVFSTPAIGDITGDGRPDVVYGSFNNLIYAKDANGHDLPGWPHMNYDTIWSSPALADINGDGKKEVIVGTDLGGGAAVFGCSAGIRGTLSILDGSGRFTPNFPKCMDTPIWSSPAVQDINGDGTLDVVAGTNNYIENGHVLGQDNVVRSWDTRSGRQLWSTALASGSRVFSSPAIGDVGSKGSLDVAVGMIASGNYGEVYLLDAKTGSIKWHHGDGHESTCACQFMGSPVMADVSGDGKPDVVALSQDGGLNAWDQDGNAVISNLHAPPPPGAPAWQHESYMFFNSPAVADLGDGHNDIVLAGAVSGSNPLQGKVWIVSTPGTGTAPWPFFKKTPDRLSASGKGSFYNPTAVAPPVAHSSTPSQYVAPSHATSRAGGAPSTTTSPTSPSPQATGGATATTLPTTGPQAVGSPKTGSSTSMRAILSGVGALLLLGAGALVMVRFQRRVR